MWIVGVSAYMISVGTVSRLGIRLSTLSTETGNSRRTPTNAQSTTVNDLGAFLNNTRNSMTAIASHPAVMLILNR